MCIVELKVYGVLSVIMMLDDHEFQSRDRVLSKFGARVPKSVQPLASDHIPLATFCAVVLLLFISQ